MMFFVLFYCHNDAFAGHSFNDFLDLMFRIVPDNGPVETPVESWSVLAPGTGGMGAATCGMCMDQMDLYEGILMVDEPFTEDTLHQYYKEGQVGLYGESTYERNPRSYYPDQAWKDIIEESKKRGYDKPIIYEPPVTLVARIDWDEFHVPHIVGEKIEDVTYGLGYATVYTNMFELLLLRFAGTSGIIQTGLDLFHMDFSDLEGIFEELMKIEPVNYTRDEMMDTLDPLACDDALGESCQELLSAMVAYREGINKAIKARYPVLKMFDTIGLPWPRWEVSDSVAPGLAMAGVFGDPGSDQIKNLITYRAIEKEFGSEKAMDLFDDYQLRHAPLDTTTVTAKDAFPNPVYADGSTDSDPLRWIDDASIAWVDLEEPGLESENNAYLDPEKPHASNWMMISAEKSATGHPLLVGGPQMRYVQPNIFMEFDARTTDETFQITGISIPGLFIAAFAGSGHNGVWTPTSAIGKTSELFIEKLCSPDNTSPVDPKSTYYMHNGECKQMIIRKNYGTPFTVHGPVLGWGTVDGAPVAVTKKSYHGERMGQSIFPFFLLAKGEVKTAEEFVNCMETFTLAVNYAYINGSEIAYINTGLYPVRAKGAQMDFPVWGTGEWDWTGVIPLSGRPHVINPEEGYLVSWNNQSAPEFYKSDGDFQRVQLLRQQILAKELLDLPSLANIAQKAALQDAYALSFLPLLKTYLNGYAFSEDNDVSDMINELTAWVEDKQAKRSDADNDGYHDDAGPAITDRILTCLKEELEKNLNLGLGEFDFPSGKGSAYQDDTMSLVRLLLNRAIENGNDLSDVNTGLFQCGDGTFEGCRDVIVTTLVNARSELAMAFGSPDPSLWLKGADHIEFIPVGPKDYRWQNRPTFQQVATVH